MKTKEIEAVEQAMRDTVNKSKASYSNWFKQCAPAAIRALRRLCYRKVYTEKIAVPVRSRKAGKREDTEMLDWIIRRANKIKKAGFQGCRFEPGIASRKKIKEQMGKYGERLYAMRQSGGKRGE